MSQIKTSSAGITDSQLIAQLNAIIQNIEDDDDTVAQQTATVTGLSEENNGSLNSIPELEDPSGTIDLKTMRQLCAAALMTLLNLKERQDTVSSGLAALRANAEYRQQVNQERIEKLEEQAEKAKHQSLLDKIKKAFSIIASALELLVAGLAIAATVACPNPATAIGATLLIASSIESIMSSASDGKLSIANACAQNAEAHGRNVTAASIAGSILTICIGLAGTLCSGVGAANSASMTSKLFSSGKQIANLSMNITTATVNIGASATGIAEAVNTRDVENIKADTKILEAVLSRLQIAQEFDTRQIEEILERCRAGVETVRNCLKSCNEALKSVATGSSAAVTA